MRSKSKSSQATKESHSSTGVNPAVRSVVRSMTGYGRAAETGSQGRLVAEVRSVNGRFLKLGVRVPSGYGVLEDRIKTLLTEKGLRRGSVDVGIYFEDSGAEGGGYRLDAAVLQKYAKQAKTLAKTMGLKNSLSMQALLGLPGAVTRKEEQADVEAVWERCAKVLSISLAQLDQMRLTEGAALAADIRKHLDGLRAHREALVHMAPAAMEKAIAKLKERVIKITEQLNTGTTLSHETLEREVVVVSDRMDISEELARLESHFAQMEAELKTGGETGKKLDFITQELLREVNTIGSKAQDQDITHRVVEMKTLIEKIREQVQNLE